jgi:phosphoribosylformylglycinamidine synthase PurS subunit
MGRSLWSWATSANARGLKGIPSPCSQRPVRDVSPMNCQDWSVAFQLVPLFRARVQVSLRPSVLDPAGEATRAAAGRLGVEGIQRLRIGKAIDVELEAPDPTSARQQLELLSDRLLANPVIEDWTLELLEEP